MTELVELEDPRVPILELAARYARAGMRVFPVDMRVGRDGKYLKTPPHGYLWKERASSNVNEVVEDMLVAIEMLGEANVGIGWALGLDGCLALDLDHETPPWWSELVSTYTAVNHTMRGVHVIYRQPTGRRIGNGTGRFPASAPWGEVRGHGGYIIVAGPDRPGFQVDQLLRVQPFPRPEWLTDAGADAVALELEELREWLEAHSETPSLPGKLAGYRTKLAGWREGDSRHDTAVRVACWIAREAAAGIVNAREALELLGGWWRRVGLLPGRRLTDRELASIVRWSVGIALSDPARIVELAAREGGAYEVDISELVEVVVETFWTERPVFDQIRRAAYSRGRSAEAVLAGVLARVALLTPHTLRLPPIVGTWATVDVIIGLVGPPGSGKSSSYGIAGELVPTERIDVVDGAPLGSGEGIAEAYYGIEEEEREDSKGRTRKVKVRKLTRRAALIYADEGQSLVDLGRRRGSILFAELRKAWSGQTLGQGNASDETRRLVPAGGYRFVLVAGWQPEYAAEVLADAVGGLPQRIYWASTVDARIPPPDDRPSWPGPLTWSPPATIPGRDLELEEAIVVEVRAMDWTRQTGRSIADDLDAHAGLLRLKLASLLALLDERVRVDVEDWRLAGELLDTSTNRRRAASAAASERIARETGERNRSLARRDAALEDDARTRALERAAKAIGRRAARDGGEVTGRDLARAVASRDRQIVTVDEAIEIAVEHGWITPSEEGERWVAGTSRPT